MADGAATSSRPGARDAVRLVVDGVIFEYQHAGGISRMYRECLPLACEADPALEIRLFTGVPVAADHLPSHPRITYEVLPPIGRWLRPARLWRPILPTIQRYVLRSFLGDGAGQIWHSTYYTSPPDWRGSQIVTVYDMIHEKFAEEFFGSAADADFRAQKRRCVENADAVICISEATRNDVLAHYSIPANRVDVVPLAASARFTPPEPGEPASRPLATRPFLLYVGDRRAHKDFELLLRVFGQWGHRNEVDLVVVGGDDWTSEEGARMEAYGIGERVHRIVAASDDELRALYGRAVALVYPSRYEGFGIPVLEALACGCPLIASRIPSTLEIAGDCARYFTAGDEQGLLAALDRAVLEGIDPRLREAGLERARAYSWRRTAEQTLEVYRRVAGKGRAESNPPSTGG